MVKVKIILIFLIFQIKLSICAIDPHELEKKVAVTSQEIQVMQENFHERVEAIIKLANESQEVIRHVKISLNTNNNNTNLYPKLLQIIEDISEIVNGIFKLNDAPFSTEEGTTCENIEQNIKKLQFYIKKFMKCQKIAVVTSTCLSMKRLALKIEKVLKYNYLKIEQENGIKSLLESTSSIIKECRKFIWFTITSVARESLQLGRMTIFKYSLCSENSDKADQGTTQLVTIIDESTSGENVTALRDIETFD